MHPRAGIHTDKLGRCLTTYPTKAYPFRALFKYHLPGASSRCRPGVTSLEDWDSTVELYLHWSWRQKSNPQPTDYKSVALPIELRQHVIRLFRTVKIGFHNLYFHRSRPLFWRLNSDLN